MSEELNTLEAAADAIMQLDEGQATEAIETEVVETEELEALPEIDEQLEVAEEEDENVMFSDVAEHLGVEAADLYEAQVLVPIGDDHEPVSISALKDAYKNQEAQTAAQETFDTERQNWENQQAVQRQQMEQAQQNIANQSAMAGQMPKELQDSNARLQALEMEYNAVDWAKLEESDPAKAVLGQNKFREAAQQEQSRYQEASQNLQQQQQYAHSQRMQAEVQKVQGFIPAWKDAEVYQKDNASMQDFFKSYGMHPQEVAAVQDARVMHILHDLWKQKSEQVVAKKNVKIAKKQGQVLKAGGLKVAGSARTRSKNLRSKLKQSGRVDDAAQLLYERMR